MKFIADLHIHSRFSMATAKNLDFEHLHMAAQLKGITVVGTGDCTHPGWFDEIQAKLVPAESGLFRLNDAAARQVDARVPASCRRAVRFILSVEISNIYKKNGRTRKNHNLVFFPDLASAAAFNKRLDAIGNITSDGRPILGLDAKHLLEISLESSEQSFFIPAHVWTPWFSLLGSKSGFDSIEECFEDLSDHIFAVETGLSSDPVMNWRVSDLDGLTLVSNSDAHSPGKLGREANLLNTTLSYAGIRSVIKSGDPDKFLGTFEFYPEEGKYHLDGHRKCNVCLHPSETHALDGKCPVCGKPITCGVLYRVEALADRPEGRKPESAHPFVSMVPLTDILSEIFQVGPNTKKVRRHYTTILDKLGSEFDVLNELSTESLASTGVPLLAQAVDRMRRGQMELIPGYDGEFGRIRIFKDQERQQLMGQRTLFSIPVLSVKGEGDPCVKEEPEKEPGKPTTISFGRPLVVLPLSDIENTRRVSSGLNEDQYRAVTHSSGPLLISAGPGTGKTRTLTHRIAYLIREKNIAPKQILAVTFTAKAAREMRDRLEKLVDAKKRDLPVVSTFHAFCLKQLLAMPDGRADGVIDDRDRDLFLDQARRKAMADAAGEISLAAVREAVVSAKQRLESPAVFKLNDESENCIISKCYNLYQDLLTVERRFDYEDLIFYLVKRLEQDVTYREACTDRFKYIFIDEYQDLNYGQYRLIKALAPPDKDLCVIGDPDQSIYGFRGSDVQYFKRFLDDYPTAAQIQLTQNYRSDQTILDVAFQVIAHRQPAISTTEGRARIYSARSRENGLRRVGIMEMASERAEAEALAERIENLVGGGGYHRVDTGRVADANLSEAFSFSDVAILYRTDRQQPVIADALSRRGIPFQVASRERASDRKEMRQLISLVKVTSQIGTFADFNRIIRLIPPVVGKEAADQFINWGMDNQFDFNTARIHARRFPISGIGRAFQRKLVMFFAALDNLVENMDNMELAEKMSYLMSHTRLNDIVKKSSELAQTFHSLVERAEIHGQGAVDFFDDIALQTDTDVYVSQAEKVTLMTMHAAKGLEFPVVFIAGCEQGYLPFRRSEHDPVNVDEERRLFYVAITRAERQLYFAWAKSRLIYGKKVSRSPSPFVGDIEKRLLQTEAPVMRKRKIGPTQLKLF